MFADGHDFLTADLILTSTDGRRFLTEFASLGPGLDLYQAKSRLLDQLGTWKVQVEAWIDEFSTWVHEIEKKHEAGMNIDLEIREGLNLIHLAEVNALAENKSDAELLLQYANAISRMEIADQERVRAAQEECLARLMRRYGSRGSVSRLQKEHFIRVDRVRAVYGSWYELFPRSAGREKGRHGTFHDVVAQLDDLANLGFHVIYLPPIHPIGFKFRKGPNNSLIAGPDDPGSPWAIGNEAGGHTAIHPELGSFEDFQILVQEANRRGMELALDIAFQCSPDHPWLKEHPEWFKIRPDGSIRYAENPPKKYQDIHPLNFECEDWQGLWNALRDVIIFWVGKGVRVFRVDNPHTKPFAFWEWCLAEVCKVDPGVIFLAEAFTRPKLKKRLAKAGFSQSYTYFTWRNSKEEITEYFTELTQSECREYLRPNLFVNTPDILHAFLQEGGPIAFRIRLILAATLGATYGIYGPPFENCVGTPAKPGSEEYLDSEKYEIRHWNLHEPGNLRPLVRLVNEIRTSNPALQRNETLQFHVIDNPRLIAYSKLTPARDNRILVVVNLHPHQTEIGMLDLKLDYFDISPA
ncbi:MAG: maltotransferase domain-containing protein, partial [bacterium]